MAVEATLNEQVTAMALSEPRFFYRAASLSVVQISVDMAPPVIVNNRQFEVAVEWRSGYRHPIHM